MNRGGHRIDWSDPFDIVAPFATHKGGVIHVLLEDGSPDAAFLRVLREHLEDGDWPKPWKTVQIDSDNSNTHYLDDAISQIVDTLGLKVSEPSPAGVSIQIGNDIDASESVTVSHNTINVLGARLSSITTGQFADALRVGLAHNRYCIIMYHTHKFNEKVLNAFHSKLWEARLSSLLEEGLLLIDVHHEMKMRSKNCSWPPAANAKFLLPSNYSAEDRKIALADLSELALLHKIALSEEEANGVAATVIRLSADVRAVHANFATLIAKSVMVNG